MYSVCVFVLFIYFFISFVCLLGKCVLEMICVRHDVNIAARFVKKMTLTRRKVMPINLSSETRSVCVHHDKPRCSSLKESLFDNNFSK